MTRPIPSSPIPSNAGRWATAAGCLVAVAAVGVWLYSSGTVSSTDGGEAEESAEQQGHEATRTVDGPHDPIEGRLMELASNPGPETIASILDAMADEPDHEAATVAATKALRKVYESDSSAFDRARDMLFTLEDDRQHRVVSASLAAHTAAHGHAESKQHIDLASDLVDLYFSRPADIDRANTLTDLETVTGRGDVLTIVKRADAAETETLEKERAALEEAVRGAKQDGTLDDQTPTDELVERAID